MKLVRDASCPHFYLSGHGPILGKEKMERKMLEAKKDEARLYRTGLKKEKSPIFYLSGRHGTGGAIETDWIKRTGCRYRCYSYVYVAPGAFYWRKPMEEAYRASIDLKCNLMMDSGAFSFHKFVTKSMGAISGMKTIKKVIEGVDTEKYREEVIDKYVEFCKSDRKHWDFYCNFDWLKHSPTIYAMQKSLEKRGIRPTPVFHGDEGLDWLKRYIDDGHKLICIGSTDKARRTWREKRYYFDQVFNLTEKYNVLCHGLAFTSLSLVFAYPWYSVDSSTWARISGFGHIIVVDPDTRIAGQLHVSDREATQSFKSYNRMPKAIQKQIAGQVESHGFDFMKVRKNLDERAVYNGWIFANLAKLDLRRGEDKIAWTNLF